MTDGPKKAKMEVPKEYRDMAKIAIRTAMARNDISYRELKDRLQEMSQEFSEQSLRNKVNRASFGADFFLMVLAACGERIQELLPSNNQGVTK